MAVKFDIIDDIDRLRVLGDEWRDLAALSGRGAFFRSPTWLLPWWHAYRRVLDAELFVLAGRGDDGGLVCLAPFYRRLGRVGSRLKVREIRMLGDAGPRPPALDILVAAGAEEDAGKSLAKLLFDVSSEWDLIDLEPLEEPSRVRAFFMSALSSTGHHVESSETGGARRIILDVPGNDARHIETEVMARVCEDDPLRLRKRLSGLRRLSRVEWADREETSPLCDAEAARLIEEVTDVLAGSGRLRLARLDDAAGLAVAAALVVDDGDGAVVLAMAVDPETKTPNAAQRLLGSEAKAAAERGLKALVVVTGAVDYELPALPASRQRAMRVSVYGTSAAAKVARTYGALRRRVEAARLAPGAAAAGARAAWSKIRTAAVNITSKTRLHLYRGQMWTRGIEPARGLDLSVLGAESFENLGERDRADIIELLELDIDYCRQKWERGDLVAYATLKGRPAGIGWCARRSVEVPELDRTIVLKQHEAYIHDVFVAPGARGRAVAPAMLEFMAQQLRQDDVYRSWALIASDNVASIRAFEKASFTAVADVVYAHGGSRERLVIRPPDPEAKLLLGVS